MPTLMDAIKPELAPYMQENPLNALFLVVADRVQERVPGCYRGIALDAAHTAFDGRDEVVVETFDAWTDRAVAMARRRIDDLVDSPYRLWPAFYTEMMNPGFEPPLP